MAKIETTRAVITDKWLSDIDINNEVDIAILVRFKLSEQGIKFEDDRTPQRFTNKDPIPCGKMMIYQDSMTRETVYLQYLNLEQ